MTVVFALVAPLAAVVGVFSTSTDESDQSILDYGVLLLTALGLGAAMILVAIGWALWGTNPSPTGSLRLVYEADAPGWWREHRSAVLLGILTNAIVGALFFTLGLIVGG